MGFADPGIPWLDLNEIGRSRDAALAHLRAREAEHDMAQDRLRTSLDMVQFGANLWQRGQELDKTLAQRDRVEADRTASALAKEQREAARLAEKQATDDALKVLELGDQPGGEEKIRAYAGARGLDVRELPAGVVTVPQDFLGELDPIAAQLAGGDDVFHAPDTGLAPEIQSQLDEIPIMKFLKSSTPSAPVASAAPTSPVEEIGPLEIPTGFGGFEIMIGGRPVVVDPAAAQRAKLVEGERSMAANVARYTSALAGMEADPMHAEGLRAVRAGANPDAIATAIAQKMESRRAAEISAQQQLQRTRIMAAAQGQARDERPASPSQSTAAARLAVMVPEMARIESLPPLSDQARKVLFQELAFKNAAEKNPTADSLLRYTGFRKQISQLLQGTDRVAYASYMSASDPLVRQRTGANAPPHEVANLLDPIIPSLGDRPADLAAKRARRRNVVRSFLEEVDPRVRARWESEIEEIYNPDGGMRRVHPTLGPGTLHPDGTFEVD